MNKTAIGYYFQSISTLLRGFCSPIDLIKAGLNFSQGQTQRVRLKNGLVFEVFSLMDVWVIKETILDRQYEKVGVPLQKDWTVVDIGAALGDYAVWAARQLPHGRLIAAEPFPLSVEVMRRNLQMNRVTNAEIFEGAISSSTGDTTLKVVGKVVQNSTASSGGKGNLVTVQTITLEKFFEQNNIEKCDYLKMDCEGGEYEILFSAAKETLNKVDRLCMEVHDKLTAYNHSQMVDFLERNGYQTRLTQNPVHRHLAYLYAEKNIFRKRTHDTASFSS